MPMRGSASTPALAVLDEARQAARERATASLNRSQSLTASTLPPTAAAHYTSLVQATPFFALPGVSSSVTSFARSYSRAANLSLSNNLNASYGSVVSSLSRMSGASHARGDSAVSSLSPSMPGTPMSQVSFAFDVGGDDEELIPDHQLNPPLTSPLLLAVTCAVLSSFQVGLNSALLNVPEAVIRRALSLSDFDWSLVISVFCIGGLVGCSLGGFASDRLGRKNFLVTNNVLFIVGALLQALASNVTEMVGGRFLVGVACGGCTVVVPLYLGEIAPANLRGSLGTMNQFATVIGILVAVVVGRPMGTAEEWRYLVGLVLLPSMLQIVMSASLLESPLWLVLTGGTKGMSQAEEILCSLRGLDNVDLDLDAMVYHRDVVQQQAKQGSSLGSTVRSLTRPSYRRPLLTGMALQVSQQLSGINAVFYYSTAFFVRAHVEDPWLGSVLCCAVNVLATWWALSIMDRVGRKTLLLVSATGMAASAIALTFFLTAPAPTEPTSLSTLSPLVASATAPLHSSGESWLLSPAVSSYLSILFVLLYVTFFELGLGPIPWTIGVEIYPAAIRGPRHVPLLHHQLAGQLPGQHRLPPPGGQAGGLRLCALRRGAGADGGGGHVGGAGDEGEECGGDHGGDGGGGGGGGRRLGGRFGGAVHRRGGRGGNARLTAALPLHADRWAQSIDDELSFGYRYCGQLLAAQ